MEQEQQPDAHRRSGPHVYRKDVRIPQIEEQEIARSYPVIAVMRCQIEASMKQVVDNECRDAHAEESQRTQIEAEYSGDPILTGRTTALHASHYAGSPSDVAAVYDRRFSRRAQIRLLKAGKPTVTDRRYSEEMPVNSGSFLRNCSTKNKRY
jgi:hypothetical protein